MKSKWTRLVALGMTSLAGAEMLIATGGPPASAAKPAPGAGGAAVNTAAKVLGEIADAPANRSQIGFTNLAALWRSAGLSGVPSLKDVLTAKGKGFAASNEIIVGSPLGTGQLSFAAQDPAPFGYNILSLSQEVVVGSLPNELSEVWGPIKVGPLSSALRKLKAVEGRAGSTQVFDVQAAARQVTKYPQLEGISRMALAGGGGRLTSGGPTVPATAVTALADGKAQARSLASDPAVKQLLAVFPTNATTLTMGTSFVTNPLGGHASPQAIRVLLTRSGLGKLTAPTFAGLSFSGQPDAAQVTAAAVYRSAAEAKAAATAVGANLRTGTSPLYNVPYSTLWHMTGSSTHGDVAVIQLSTRTPERVDNLVNSAGFPLFWSQ